MRLVFGIECVRNTVYRDNRSLYHLWMITVNRSNDFSEVSDLLLAFLGAIGEPAPDREALDRIGDAARAGHMRFFVAKNGDERVGLCSLTLGFSTYKAGPFGTIEDLYVAEAWRGRGVTRALLDALIQHARAEGCRSVLGGCSRDDVPMWKHFEFRPIGVLMAKDV